MQNSIDEITVTQYPFISPPILPDTLQRLQTFPATSASPQTTARQLLALAPRNPVCHKLPVTGYSLLFLCAEANKR